MSILLALLLICLILIGTILRAGGLILFALLFLILIALAITLFVRLVEMVAGNQSSHSSANPIRASSTRPSGSLVPRKCPNSLCKRVNPWNARFCGRCGQAL